MEILSKIGGTKLRNRIMDKKKTWEIERCLAKARKFLIGALEMQVQLHYWPAADGLPRSISVGS